MRAWIIAALLTGFAGCGHPPSLSPTELVVGIIDGPGPFTIRVPAGYALDPITSSGLVRRWTRPGSDPTIELDASPSEEGEIYRRGVFDEPLPAFPGSHSSVFRELANGQTQVVRFGRGDDQLNCYITYPGREDPYGARVKSGQSICDSMVFTPHDLTDYPDVLHPAITTIVRLDFPSRASAQVRITFPKRYIEHPSSTETGKNFWHGVSVGHLPAIVLAGRSKASTCASIPSTSRGPIRDGILICEDEMEVVIFGSTRAGAGETAECRVHLPKRDTRRSGLLTDARLLSAATMEEREKDAISICASIKVLDYQNIGESTE